MELGKARVPNKGHDKTTSFSLDSKLKQRFFRINVDTYFCNASIKPTMPEFQVSFWYLGVVLYTVLPAIFVHIDTVLWEQSV